MAAEIGHVFEAEVRKVLDLLKTAHHVAFHRLADTKSAGAVIAEQPADYLVGLPRGSQLPGTDQRMFFLEAKASTEKTTLGKAAMQPAQRGAIARWRHLAQLPYLVLFWDSVGGTLQLWDGIKIMSDKNLKRSDALEEWVNCGMVTKLRTEYVAKLLVEYFEIPDGAATLASAEARKE